MAHWRVITNENLLLAAQLMATSAETLHPRKKINAMDLPPLRPSPRSREYNAHPAKLRAEVIRAYLFRGLSHRELDGVILGLDRVKSRGWQSMGILHCLGMKKEFRGIFKGLSEEAALALFVAAGEEFTPIVEHLKTTKGGSRLISLPDHLDEEQHKTAEAAGASENNRLERIGNEPKLPEKKFAIATVYDRSPHVAAQVLARANGCCEWCGTKAPFIRASDGTPYLEVHHVVHLADGGRTPWPTQ